MSIVTFKRLAEVNQFPRATTPRPWLKRFSCDARTAHKRMVRTVGCELASKQAPRTVSAPKATSKHEALVLSLAILLVLGAIAVFSVYVTKLTRQVDEFCCDRAPAGQTVPGNPLSWPVQPRNIRTNAATRPQHRPACTGE